MNNLFAKCTTGNSVLFFHKEAKQQQKLISTIKLRLRIIIFFFMGGVIGGVLYSYLNLSLLILPATLLIIAYFTIAQNLILSIRSGNTILNNE
jgi:uncharacterized membrane protein YoaK (UPF0700 family)